MTERLTYRRYRTSRPWRRAGAPLVLVFVGLVAAVAIARAGDPLQGAKAASGPKLIADGVTIGGVAVGGLTPRQATSEVEEAFGERLVLTGRSSLPPREEWPARSANGDATIRQRIADVRDLESRGAEVLYVAADVAGAEDMREVVRRAHERFGPIRGVVHAAGVP